MKFMDKKEQVLDIQMTPYGEYLLSKGIFKPEYYAFYDDNILYEPQYAGHTNVQNDIEPRIQENTPQLETQAVFSSRDIFIRKSLTGLLGEQEIVYTMSGFGCVKVDIGQPCPPTNPYRNLASPDYCCASLTSLNPAGTGVLTSAEVAAGMGQQEITVVNEGEIRSDASEITDTYFDRKMYLPQSSLGSSDILATDAPAWSISMLRGEISGSARTDVGSLTPTLNVPQLDVTLTYRIDTKASADLVSDTELAIEYSNGEFLDVKPEIILAQIIERNAEFSKDNFDIEVFEVTTEKAPGLDDLVEKLRPLKFRKPYSLVQGNLLLDAEEVAPVSAPINSDYVEYYFNIKVDSQIDNQLICSSIDSLESRGFYVDTEIECPEVKNITLVDIYSTDAASEDCPDVDDPCTGPGTIY